MSGFLKRDDVVAYALGAVNDLEREAIVGRMRRDQDMAREADALAEVAALMALGVPSIEPPRALRDRVLEAVRAR